MKLIGDTIESSSIMINKNDNMNDTLLEVEVVVVLLLLASKFVWVVVVSLFAWLLFIILCSFSLSSTVIVSVAILVLVLFVGIFCGGITSGSFFLSLFVDSELSLSSLLLAWMWWSSLSLSNWWWSESKGWLWSVLSCSCCSTATAASWPTLFEIESLKLLLL